MFFIHNNMFLVSPDLFVQISNFECMKKPIYEYNNIAELPGLCFNDKEIFSTYNIFTPSDLICKFKNANLSYKIDKISFFSNYLYTLGLGQISSIVVSIYIYNQYKNGNVNLINNVFK